MLPSISRKEAGNSCGKIVAATLSRNAAPVPRPMSVNIFGLRLTSDDQKRSKNGQPPQRTTGVESNNSIQLRNAPERGSGNFSPDIPRTRTETVKIALQKEQ